MGAGAGEKYPEPDKNGPAPQQEQTCQPRVRSKDLVFLSFVQIEHLK